jgi:riboflavin transporter FmnP
MKNNYLLTRRLAVFAALAAISALFQLLHIGFKTQWGMWIDIVAVPWIVAYFLFGIRGGLTVSLVGSIIITLMFLVLYGVTLIFKKNITQFKKLRNIILPVLVAISLRGILMFFFNYYFALPIWIPGKTSIELMNIFPWYIIVGINAVQGVIDVVFAWILVFPYKLSRFSQKSN